VPTNRGPHQQRVNPRSAKMQRHRSTAPRGSDESAVWFYRFYLSGFRVERVTATEREECENTSLRKRSPSALSRHHTLFRDQHTADQHRRHRRNHRRDECSESYFGLATALHTARNVHHLIPTLLMTVAPFHRLRPLGSPLSLTELTLLTAADHESECVH